MVCEQTLILPVVLILLHKKGKSTHIVVYNAEYKALHQRCLQSKHGVVHFAFNRHKI